MKLTPNLVSIILPVYNAAGDLADCLDSLSNQTYEELEIIAFDDFSSDSSHKILRDWKKKDIRIKVYRNKKRYGIAVCYNRALKKARGQYAALMNPHNISSLHRIKRQVKYLTNHQKVAVVGSQCTYINLQNKKLGNSFFPTAHDEVYRKLLDGSGIEFETTMINRAILPKDILHFTKKTYPFVYTEVFLKVLSYGKLANIDQYLYFLRATNARLYSPLKNIDLLFSSIKLSLKSAIMYDYRPSAKSLLTPILFPLRTIFQ